MDKNRVENLMAAVLPEDRAALSTLYNASVATLRAYQTDNAAGRLRDWQAAEAALDELVKKLEGGDKDDGIVFKNRKEVLSYLKGQGYKIGQTKVYTDRLLRVQKDGSILERDVERYIKAAGLDKKTGKTSAVIEELTARIKRLEAEKLAAQVIDLNRKNEIADGQYMLKTDIDMEFAARVIGFDTVFRIGIISEVCGWMHADGLDPKLITLRQELLNERFDQHFAEMARTDRFQVIIESEEVKDEH